jgi:dipeptidyl aminopeptidase/acylaminoacyl peptidase
MFHRLALAGFAVIAPMYRGSDGGQGQDEMGGADVSDLANVGVVVRRYPSFDAGNVFLYGESRGGMMVLQAIRDGFPARAAATFGAFADLAKMTGNKAGGSMAHAIWPDFALRRDEIVDRRSALRWAERLTLPLLVMHGGNDREVPVSHALELAVAVSGAVRELGVVVFPGGSHTLNEVRTERDRLAVDFFRRHLEKPGA